MMTFNEICEVAVVYEDIKDSIREYVDARKSQFEINGLFITALQILICDNGQIVGSQRWKEFIDSLAFDDIDNTYLATELLDVIVELELVTFDMLTFAITKLDLCTSDKNVEEIKKYLKTLRSDLVRAEMKNTNSTKNMNLLNFINAIDYQVFEGQEYAELEDAYKVVCLAGDFLEITGGQYSLSDILMLKTEMMNIGISPKEKLNFGEVLTEMYDKPILVDKILNKEFVDNLENPKEYVALAYLNKRITLEKNESYIVRTIENILNRNGIEISRTEITKDITNKYLKNDLLLDVDHLVDAFDMVVDLVYETNQYQQRA